MGGGVRGGGGGKWVVRILEFYWGDFLPGEGNLMRSDFDDSNLFQS